MKSKRETETGRRWIGMRRREKEQMKEKEESNKKFEFYRKEIMHKHMSWQDINLSF